MKFYLALMLMIESQTAQAELPSGQLSGSYFFSEESCGADGKSASCKMSFNLTGKSAKLLYNRMNAKAVYDECTEGQIKTDANGLSCYKVKDEFNCHFGYNIAERKLTDSDVTC
jgi:hypothetical protein